MDQKGRAAGCLNGGQNALPPKPPRAAARPLRFSVFFGCLAGSGLGLPPAPCGGLARWALSRFCFVFFALWRLVVASLLARFAPLRHPVAIRR